MIFLLFLLALPDVQALGYKDGTGKLPSLGWNHWNAYGCSINETKVMQAANSMVSLGLLAAGYNYVNIDDCWAVKPDRDAATGEIVADPNKFPSGMKGLTDKIHALGLKAGIYSSSGTHTCAGTYPASIGKESLDAATFASWGMDYLKYDNCNYPANWTDEYFYCVPDSGLQYTPMANGTCSVSSRTAPASYDWSTSNTAQRFNNMRDALLAQNRTILFNLCEWGDAKVQSWGNATGSSWRISGDIKPKWNRIMEIMNENSFLLNSVDFWGHNDADMLEVGNGQLTLEENRSHFAFWAAMKSPLIMGTVLDQLPATHLAILKNKYLLAFSQDEVFGPPAKPYKWGTNPDWTFNSTHPAEYWSGQGSSGTLVMAMNTLTNSATRQISWSEVPQLNGNASSAFEVTDVWSGQSMGCVQQGIEATVSTHDTVAYIVGEACAPTARRMRL